MPSDANSRVVSDFLDYLRIEKGLAALSISAYTSDIGQFAGFLDQRKRNLLNARRNDVREFLQQLFSHQVDGRSVGRKLSAQRYVHRPDAKTTAVGILERHSAVRSADSVFADRETRQIGQYRSCTH